MQTLTHFQEAKCTMPTWHILLTFLEDYHHLNDKQVMNLSGWIYGDEIQKLEKSTDMVVKATGPNAEGNQGMVNCLNIRIHIISCVVHMNFKNHLTLQYYKYSPTENKYLY